MSRPGVVFGVWAAFLAVLAVVLWTVFVHPRYWLLYALPGLAIGGTALMAVMAARRPRRPTAVETVTELSLASALTAVALALILIGTQAGIWLVLMGVGALAFGLGGLARERRSRPERQGR
ncbi:MAG: hypothetical protein ACR2K9_07875 [Solirubrobacteraceae bacterium]